MNNGRIGYSIRDTEVMQAIDQILFESPELKDSVYLMHRKQVIAEIEDEGERAPPLSALIDEDEGGGAAAGPCTHINPVESVIYRPFFAWRRRA